MVDPDNFQLSWNDDNLALMANLRDQEYEAYVRRGEVPK